MSLFRSGRAVFSGGELVASRMITPYWTLAYRSDTQVSGKYAVRSDTRYTATQM